MLMYLQFLNDCINKTQRDGMLRRQAFAFSGGPLYFFPFKGLLDNATL